MHIPMLQNRRFILVRAAVFAVVVLAVSKPSAAEGPAGTAFTYQGDLKEADTPVDGAANFKFSLWDDQTNSDEEAWLGRTLSRTVNVEEGQFNVILDFCEDAFRGNARWLEIAMCSPAPCRDFTTLTPRRELSPTAYALLPLGEKGNVQGPRTAQAQPSPKVPPGQAKHFWALKGNENTTPGTNFLGTTDNEARELHVNGEQALRLEPDATCPNLIGGYGGNSVEPNAVGAAIAGGGPAAQDNRVFDNHGTVGGGAGTIRPAATTPIPRALNSPRSPGAKTTPPTKSGPLSAGASPTSPAASDPPLAGVKATPPAAMTPPSAVVAPTPPAGADPPSPEAD